MARFEAKGSAYHRAGRARASCALAGLEPERFAVLDAAPGEDEVAAAVWQAVSDRFGLTER